MSVHPLLSKEVNFRRIIKVLVITIPVLVIIFVIGNHIDNALRKYYYKEKTVLGLENTETRVIGEEGVKELLKGILPEEYELVELTPDELLTADEGCTKLFKVYPKKYSETQRKYFSSANLIYCKDIEKAVFRSQLEENKYDPKRDAWARIGVGSEKDITLGYYEQRYFGDNLVSIVERWGSGYSGDIYVLRMDNSRELVALSVPTTSRIFCGEYYNGQGEVSWDKECIESLDSIGMHSASGNDWVPQEKYQNDYKELVNMLGGI